ncbi:MAG: NAD(P)H-hydrate dehydratase [SAR202 cluster bacterium]|nr:NAD(P)H-hydrate dehydratase [SAR202 cluster bacterium]
MKIVTSGQMRLIEERSESVGVSMDQLMENAGLAVAERIRDKLVPFIAPTVVILVGPGKNGGDGLVTARHLHTWGIQVFVYQCATRPDGDVQLQSVRKLGVPLFSVSEDEDLKGLKNWLSGATLVLDSVLGTGRSRPIQGQIGEVFQTIEFMRSQRSDLELIALDVPSGLDPDSGVADEFCLRMDATITLGCPKIGLFQISGAELAGRIEIVPIGIPIDGISDDVRLELMTDQWAAALLPRRDIVAHKGTFGRTLVIAGSRNYIGAAYLASAAAARVGTGLVTLAIPESLQLAVATMGPELTYIPLPESKPGVVAPDAIGSIMEMIDDYDALLVGCGFGQAPDTTEFLRRLLLDDRSDSLLPETIIDADGLNFLAKQIDWWERLDSPAVLTPHPGEMARLYGGSIREIQHDRIRKAIESAKIWDKVVVLKGAYTVVADPDGLTMVSPFANPGLASAGTGDVLAGAISGLVSQGLPLKNAAALGVYIHGLAGNLVMDELGNAGMIASDVLHALPKAIKMIHQRAGLLP